MILLDAQSMTYGLHFPVKDTSYVVSRWVDLAVKAQAILTDPIGDLTGRDSAKALFDLNTALNWLVANTSFDVEVIKTGEMEYNFFNDVLERDPLKVWTFNVDQLAAKLIERNYHQGWAEEDVHPIFNLAYPYVSDEGTDSYVLEATPLRSEFHWSQFTQAVIVQAVLNQPANQFEQEGIHPRARERAMAFVEGAAHFLARNYPVLGEHRGDGEYDAKSSSPAEAELGWSTNIVAAALKLGQELANRG